MRTPIKATARVPIKQAGYISATSGIQKILSCKQQPVHTFGSTGLARFQWTVQKDPVDRSSKSAEAPETSAFGGEADVGFGRLKVRS